jgi:hypothetical protein
MLVVVLVVVFQREREQMGEEIRTESGQEIVQQIFAGLQ